MWQNRYTYDSSGTIAGGSLTALGNQNGLQAISHITFCGNFTPVITVSNVWPLLPAQPYPQLLSLLDPHW
jgi:hypothetical protein